MTAMPERREWTVIVRRDGRFWYIDIPELGGATQARSLTEIDEMARDYIAESTDAAADSFDVQIRVELPADAAAHWAASRALFREAAEAQARAAEESRAAARALKADGLTVREIGRALDMSHQRAQQLVKG
jgi:hypothetical protein